MIIGISGFKGAGKGTIADTLVEAGFKKISFADKLKDACAVIFEWDREMLEGANDESRAWREEVDVWWAGRLGIEDFCPRLALQWMGTEAGRRVFGEDIWCAALEKFILENPANYVVPDVRFANEVRLINSMRGQTIRVRRGDEPDWYGSCLDWNEANRKNPEHNTMIPGNVSKIHESERAWIGEKFSHLVENDGTLEDLAQKTKDLFLDPPESSPEDPKKDQSDSQNTLFLDY